MKLDVYNNTYETFQDVQTMAKEMIESLKRKVTKKDNRIQFSYSEKENLKRIEIRRRYACNDNAYQRIRISPRTRDHEPFLYQTGYHPFLLRHYQHV